MNRHEIEIEDLSQGGRRNWVMIVISKYHTSYYILRYYIMR